MINTVDRSDVERTAEKILIAALRFGLNWIMTIAEKSGEDAQPTETSGTSERAIS